MPFWRKRYSPISLIRSDGSCGDLTYVSSWYSYPDRLVESDFQRFHVVLRALYPGITTSAYRSRITSNGRGSTMAIYNATLLSHSVLSAPLWQIISEATEAQRHRARQEVALQIAIELPPPFGVILL